MGVETEVQDGNLVICADVHQSGDSVELGGTAEGFDVEDAVVAGDGVCEALGYAVEAVCAYGVAKVAAGGPEPLTARRAEEEEGEAHASADGDASGEEPLFEIVVGEGFHHGIEVADDADFEGGDYLCLRESAQLLAVGFVEGADSLETVGRTEMFEKFAVNL